MGAEKERHLERQKREQERQRKADAERGFPLPLKPFNEDDSEVGGDASRP
jgi:hypothetical protein